jgi:DNA polymerase-4
MERTILHCDLNSFYASVEILLNPELSGKAMAVCGSKEDRHGIVLAKSDLAKKYGVQTGEAIWIAQQKCLALRLSSISQITRVALWIRFRRLMESSRVL